MPNAKGPLSHQELLNLWEQARQEALHLCRRTLARLRRGEGGFYTEEDFWQDLFLEFWHLAQGWAQRKSNEKELWASWRRILWGQGRRILRRAPQRLWARRERPTDPQLFTGEPPEGQAFATLPLQAREALQQQGPAELHERLARIDALSQALWRLPISQRQTLYLSALLGLPAEKVARQLRLKDARAVYRRLYRARRNLARELKNCAKRQKAKEEGPCTP
ncbi:MAG: hypothetical protein J7M05_08300 [Anaerolineae bacterium]|nr:hypothetical protein [Anaerolineae bacterium]